MNLKEAEEVGRVARQLRELDSELAWLDQQDASGFPSTRMMRGALAEIGPSPSPEMARAIRALLRRDYAAQKDVLTEKLISMGVETVR